MNTQKSIGRVVCRMGAALAALLCLVLPVAVVAQGNVVPPNGTMNADVVDLSVQTAAGPVEWTRTFNGTGWRFNRNWDGISASFKPSMTQSTGGGAPGMSYGNQSSAPSTCWIWVDEDWQPGNGVTVPIGGGGGSTPAPAVPPETYLPLNRSYSQTAVPLDTVITTGFASGCASIGGNVGGSSSEVMEGWRRQSQLYVGAGGTYIFKNRYFLRKQAIFKLPAGSAVPVGGSVPLIGAANVASGWRWSDKSGEWAEYDDEGRMSRYGDKNNNAIWLQRNAAGQLVRIVDGGAGGTAISGNVLITLHYNAAGYLVQAKDWPQAGNSLDLPQRTVTYTYDAQGHMTAVVDVRGNTTAYDYDSKSRLIKTTDPRSSETKLTYEAEGNTVKSMTAADGGVTDYGSSWDSTKKLFYSKVQGPATDAGRRTEDYSHDRAGDLVRYEVNGRTEIEVKRDPSTRTETRTNARGFATTYTRDEFEQITQIEYPDGSKRATSYDANLLNPVEETDELGVKTRYEYDGKGNLTKIIEAMGLPDERITEYQRDAAGRSSGITRKGRTETNGTVTPDATWRLSYDQAGQLAQTIDPEGKQRGYVYSRLGDLMQYTSPTGAVWKYIYDADSNQLSETDPLGRTIAAVYDATGNPTSATDERGKVYQFTYDKMGRELKQSDPKGAAYASNYNTQGSLTSVTDGGGKSMRMDYDALVRLTKATDAKGQSYSLDYAEPDGADKGARKPSQLSYPTFQRQFRYDARERTTLTNDKAGAESRIESYTWDGADRQKTVTDANGKTRYYSHTPYGEVSEVKDPLGNTVRLIRDTRGNIIEVVDANGKSTRMAYDRRNLPASTTDALGNTTAYTHDANGWLNTITRANGQKVAYDLDAVGRIAAQREYDAQATLTKTTSFTYDAAGNLLTWNDGTYSAARTYDDANQLSSETVNYGSFNLTHAYSYEGNYEIKTYTGPDGATIEYGYDDAGVLESLTIPGAGTLSVTEWQWFAPKKVVLPGGTEQRMEFDAYQGLTRLKVVNPAQATVFELQNKFGKLSEVTQSSIDGNTFDYTLDDAGQLKALGASALSGRSEAFTIDANSNRLTHSKTGSGTWVYDSASQLTQRPAAGGAGTVSYEYDASGNLTQKIDTSKTEPARTTRYTWDALTRLTEVHDGAGDLIARYQYDPFDRRIRKELGNSATLSAAGPSDSDIRNVVIHYLQSEWGILAEADGAGKIQTAYGWNPQNQASTAPVYARLADKSQPGTWRTVYYHNDHLGTPQRITDAAGTVVWSASYDAYGKATTQTTTNAATALTSYLRYPGQYWDAETGLHYNDRRYYDPDTGRYTARDPVGLGGGINPYAYAGASPNRFVDSTGELGFLVPAAWAGARAAAGAAIRWAARRYTACMVSCVGMDVAMDAAGQMLGVSCDDPDLVASFKECAKDCLWSLIPIPKPCKYARAFGAAIGIAGAATGGGEGGGGGGGGFTMPSVSLPGLPRFGEGGLVDKGLNSFPGHTLVHVRGQDGQSALKPIVDIRVGDEVLAWDELAVVDGALSQSRQLNPKQKEPQVQDSPARSASAARAPDATRYEKVSDIISSEKLQRLVHLTLDTGEKLTATDGHPFRTTEGWRDAILLKKGGKLLLRGNGDGEDRAVQTSTIADIQIELKTLKVFNLEVENLHTFFVGEEGILVHNSVQQNRSNGKQLETDVTNSINNTGTHTATNGGKGSGIKTPFGMRYPDITVRDRFKNIVGLLECKKGGAKRSASQISKDQWIEQNLGHKTTVVHQP
ncbi:RHS repeat-associated core domain-containing protein [Variovorax sp. W2I14]|uniref:RHS repeat-associated core domain-containing protein n=1 Tax=Variovorax sp. W2I14 TaxID=3042290 RepID=UPI003D1EBD8D